MTTRGRTLAALAASMLIFGRVGGMRELIMAGGAFGLVLLLGWGLVWARGGRITVDRTVRPTRSFVGGRLRVELGIQAAGRLGTGPILISDRLPRALGLSPRLALSGGTHARERTVAYAVVPRLRGRYSIGPLEITHTDPFGAVRRRRRVSGTSTITVLPAFEEITALPMSVQRLGIVRSSPLVGHGDEFYSLRPYEEGDDLRKLHWPTSFRLGELVVRQDELLAEPRALIVLDTTSAKHRGTGPTASIEAAVSACASVGVLALRKRMRLDVLTCDGHLLPIRNPSVDQLLEGLALVKPSEQPSLAGALERAYRARGNRPALVVIITPGLRTGEVRALAERVRGASGGAIVHIDASSFAGPGEAGRRRPASPGPSLLPFPVLRLRAGDSFRHVWHKGVTNVAVAR